MFNSCMELSPAVQNGFEKKDSSQPKNTLTNEI